MPDLSINRRQSNSGDYLPPGERTSSTRATAPDQQQMLRARANNARDSITQTRRASATSETDLGDSRKDWLDRIAKEVGDLTQARPLEIPIEAYAQGLVHTSGDY